MKPASRFKRFLAVIIDSLIFMIFVSLPLRTLLGILFHKDLLSYISEIYTYQHDYVFDICNQCLWLIYFVFFESSKHQATPGKKLFNLLVVTKDGKQLTIFKALYRYTMYLLPAIPIFILFLVYPERYGNIDLVNASIETFFIFTAVYIIIIVMSLIWYLPIFFTKERKCVHDMISSTRVYAKKTSITN